MWWEVWGGFVAECLRERKSMKTQKFPGSLWAWAVENRITVLIICEGCLYRCKAVK